MRWPVSVRGNRLFVMTDRDVWKAGAVQNEDEDASIWPSDPLVMPHLLSFQVDFSQAVVLVDDDPGYQNSTTSLPLSSSNFHSSSPASVVSAQWYVAAHLDRA
jgi:hypothetical protein